MKEVQFDEKTYRLWWEYLHRSKDYKEVYIWEKKGADIQNLPSKYKRPADLSGNFPTGPCKTNVKIKYPDFWELLDKYMLHVDNEKWWHVSPVLHFVKVCGDIYSISFAEWFDQMKSRVLSTRRTNKPVDLLWKTLEDTFLLVESGLKSELGRTPTLDEFQKGLIDHYRKPRYGLYVSINTFMYKTREIRDEIEKIIGEFKKHNEWKDATTFFLWRSEPVGRKHLSEIERYLGVYDIWHEWTRGNKKGSWKKRVKENLAYYIQIVRNGERLQHEINSDIEADRQKALKIIYNAERGLFPGKYN